jgi:o-succinylbenzoate---CoA ligase
VCVWIIPFAWTLSVSLLAGNTMNWESSETLVLLNPRLTTEQQYIFTKSLLKLPSFEGHVWIATSGSTEKIKFVALSKRSLLTSAESVNQHLNSTQKDLWINPLPIHHVGGLGIWARAYLSKAKVIAFDQKWNPTNFCQHIQHTHATLSSLVPTQVFDLVSASLVAPSSLRAIIVGGGALPASIYAQAQELGWPLLPSYGLTECSSQVATASLPSIQTSRSLKILPHVQVRINNQGLICLKSEALLSAYAYYNENTWSVSDPKVDGWLTTQDLGQIEEENIFHFCGRQNDQIKIGGELASRMQLEKILDEIRINILPKAIATLIFVPDDRLGHVVHLAAEQNEKIDWDRLVRAFNTNVLPYEKIRTIHFFSTLPVSSLKKPLKDEILNRILAKNSPLEVNV